MGYKHTREQILAAAVDAVAEDGLSRLSFGRLARRLGTSDRVVVYYFPSKEELVAAVLAETGARLQEVLAAAFTAPADDYLALCRAAWPVLGRAETAGVFALFFEAVGQAAAGIEPYRTLAPQLVEAWVRWLTGFLTGTPARRRAEAEAAVALLDGLLLLRQVQGPEAAARAARRLGVR